MLSEEKSSFGGNSRSSLHQSIRASKHLHRNSSFNSSGHRFVRLHRLEDRPVERSLDCYDDMERIYRNTSFSPKGNVNAPHNRKLLRNMLKRLESRGESFYRFGFRSYEKEKNLDVLQDILNVRLCRCSCAAIR